MQKFKLVVKQNLNPYKLTDRLELDPYVARTFSINTGLKSSARNRAIA